MPIFIAFDQGNTMLKATAFGPGGVVWSEAVTSGDAEDFVGALDLSEVTGMAFCSTGRDILSSLVEAAANCGIRLLRLTPETSVPLRVNYASGHTLGADRIAAAVGAASLFPGESMLVADAGTAITADIVSDGVAFNGGNISPGIAMRLKSLAAGARFLPAVAKDADVALFGHDTRSAILSGCIMGAVGELASYYYGAVRDYGVARLVLSGGDAPLILSVMRRNLFPGTDDINICYEPDLVASGLKAIYEYNEK